MKSEIDIAKILETFEREHDAFSFHYKGYSIWRLLRASVGYRLQNLPLETPNINPLKVLLFCFYSIIDLLFNRPGSASFIVKSYSSSIRSNTENKYEDIFFSKILDEIPGGYYLSSLNTNQAGLIRKNSIGGMDCTLIHMIGACMSYIFPVRNNKYIFDEVARILGLILNDGEFTSRRIRRIISSFWWQFRLFKLLLRYLNPKTVVIIDSGERAIIAACKTLDIRIIELQHGVFNPTEPDCLPKTALNNVDLNALLLPDVLALYGQYWADWHENTALGELGRLRTVGCGAIEHYRHIRLAQYTPNVECPNLVISTQGLDRDQLLLFLSQFLEFYKKPCRITIKLHPIYDNDMGIYENKFKSDLRVKVVSGLGSENLLELIAHADLHLSIASASHFEAIGVGCPTVIIGLAGHEVVDNLININRATLVKSPDELNSFLNNRSWASSCRYDVDHFFKYGYIKNMTDLIN